jgi:hypothetical protein
MYTDNCVIQHNGTPQVGLYRTYLPSILSVLLAEIFFLSALPIMQLKCNSNVYREPSMWISSTLKMQGQHGVLH